MRTITFAEFESFEIVNGIKQCPGGDYSLFNNFALCSFAEWCSFAEGVIAKDPFWSFMYPPPFKVIGRIYPTEGCRCFFSQRLMQLGVIKEPLDGCYSSIEKLLRPKLNEILSKDLTDVERAIYESWR